MVTLHLFFALWLSAGAGQQAPVDGASPASRCSVSPFRGAATPEGAVARMIVVGDGTPCAVNNWGDPDRRLNPATSIVVTAPPKHGTVDPAAPRVIYKAEAGFVGADEFAYEAKSQYPNGDPMTMRVRVQVDVRAAPFVPPVPPVRVGGAIPPPRKIKDVAPVYPPAARDAGVSGVVVVEVTIDADGKVRDPIVRRSIPMLDAAALDAVRQWEFTPTTVNGRAVPVSLTVSVSFSALPAPSPAAPVPATGPAAAPSSATAVPAGAPPSVAPIATAGLPRTADADLEQGRQALERRQYEDALKIFRRLSDQRGRQCGDCFYGMALAYQGLGAEKNVIDSCDRAIEAAGDNRGLIVEAHQAKGVALQIVGEYKNLKRLQEAEAEFRSALAIEPNAAYLHYYLGVVLMQQHRDAEGAEELKRELALRPKSIHSDLANELLANPRRAREAYAPALSLVTLSHEFVDMADLRGKIVVLDFWGTWCPPCVAAVPELRRLSKKHQNEPFVLVGISSDTDEAMLRRFVEQNEMSWPQYWDRDRKVQQTYRVSAWPTYVVIDDEGIVRLRTSGNSAAERARLGDEINRLLKAAARKESRP